ncbi:hypothetical protein ACFL35_03955 [Candidatus Riflebacteria bacterium]
MSRGVVVGVCVDMIRGLSLLIVPELIVSSRWSESKQMRSSLCIIFHLI